MHYKQLQVRQAMLKCMRKVNLKTFSFLSSELVYLPSFYQVIFFFSFFFAMNTTVAILKLVLHFFYIYSFVIKLHAMQVRLHILPLQYTAQYFHFFFLFVRAEARTDVSQYLCTVTYIHERIRHKQIIKIHVLNFSLICSKIRLRKKKVWRTVLLLPGINKKKMLRD